MAQEGYDATLWESEEALGALRYCTQNLSSNYSLKIAWPHQLQVIWSDFSGLEIGLQALRDTGRVQRLWTTEGLAIIESSHYSDEISRLLGDEGETFKRWVIENNCLSATDEELSAAVGKDTIAILLTSGLITRGDNSVYRLSHPLLGATMGLLMYGRKQLTSFLRKKKHHELDLHALRKVFADSCQSLQSTASSSSVGKKRSRAGASDTESFTLPSSTSSKRPQQSSAIFCCKELGLSYHLLDLEGRGLVSTVKKPDGTSLVRLRS